MDGSWFEPVRYYVSLALWVSLPAAIIYWILIHPLAGFWRRLGPEMTFLAMGVILSTCGYICWLWREPVLAARYPVRPTFVVVGLALYVLAIVIEKKCRKHLKTRILIGLPELSADDPGHLLTEGIYAHVRNPRYLDLFIGVLGWSLILNYRAMHWLTLICIPGLYVVTLLEERELRRRFGAPYEAYLKKVPRFIPRSWAFLRS